MMAMFHAASAFNQPLGGWDMRRVTNASGMLARADAFQQFVSGWSMGDVYCPFEDLWDANYRRVAGVYLAWHPSRRGRTIDQWLRAHDMVVLLRRSFHQSVLCRKLPVELARTVVHWLGLIIEEWASIHL
jgi:hypothetical protein